MPPSFLEMAVQHFDRALRTVAGVAQEGPANRAAPDADAPQGPGPSSGETQHIGRLMRVNYAGEVAAQGLYWGQGLTARTPEVAEKMDTAASEEQDHLNWCIRRMDATGVGPSVLNPLWLAGSVTLGAAAGLAGDRWSLGFVAETERQVMNHLQGHLGRLPDTDPATRAVVEQMYLDERSHAEWAEGAGGERLPFPIRAAMTVSSKFLTNGSYWT
ncbi:2-polyprenyl-3-methyl-6-methoxy-1,4-benzoquinone monooxygenase [Thiohalorhabdus sp.]|uniref:2-polyprenyl-3-methyl-6-methoxy-1,4-benzoquinone monooxygenase n=1 Tax=Thiohalorhabdus sp. TaxID=3094134 RepID=UPI002FC27FC7